MFQFVNKVTETLKLIQVIQLTQIRTQKTVPKMFLQVLYIFAIAENDVFLLQTAEALISFKNNNLKEEIRILFDAGAQSSFTNEEISEK